MTQRAEEDKAPESRATTEEKVQYLRDWAAEKSSRDAKRLPAIREARRAVARHFGSGLGSGLGTDVIARTLRALRYEFQNRGVQGGVAVPADKLAQLARLAQIAQMMRLEGVQELVITQEGEISALKRF